MREPMEDLAGAMQWPQADQSAALHLLSGLAGHYTIGHLSMRRLIADSYHIPPFLLHSLWPVVRAKDSAPLFLLACCHLVAHPVGGWVPKVAQSGSTLDWTRLSPRGVRQMKQTMYLIVWRAIQWDKGWRGMYERLIARKCRTDERTRRLIGREKVIGRLAGQMTSVMYTLLRKDQEILSQLAPGAEPPKPGLYDSDLHQQHRLGQYQPARLKERPPKLIQLPSP